MPAEIFNIIIEGYWREHNKAGIPSQPGIFCVYACISDPELQEVSTSKLIYVGAAENVKEIIASDESLRHWQSYLSAGEQLCFTFGPLESAFLERCAAAIVFVHKPPANSGASIEKFQYERTIITLSGHTPFLKNTFLVT
ncbi:MAG: hypothetical protein P4L50_23925 [Anaerolineaceae bacterium]|nr:hypothetical protein [Anaerolineaceae bacterium]